MTFNLFALGFKSGQKISYEDAARLLRAKCKDEACENKCWHEHLIRDRAKELLQK